MPRITFLSLFLTSALTLAGVSAQAADAWPAQPIRLVVPFAAGGGVDNVARALAAQLSEELSETVVVENRLGAGGMIATDHVARSAPDGYTLLMATQTTLAVAPILASTPGFDPKTAFAGAGLVASSPMLLVANPQFAPRNVGQLIDLAKRDPGQVNFASGGIGSSPHMAGEMLALQTGIKLTHIAYKGEQPALTDVMGNHVPIMFSNLPAALPLVQAGKLHALAISSAQRSAVVPDLPTIAESGVPGFDAVTWFGVVAPKGTPQEIVQQLGQAIKQSVANPQLRQKLEGQGLTVQPLEPAEFDTYIAAEYDKWERVIKDANITTQ
ncbi:MAG: tripartite tricarboxylate transporter substrate binding protein [Pusillimonas sp.]